MLEINLFHPLRLVASATFNFNLTDLMGNFAGTGMLSALGLGTDKELSEASGKPTYHQSFGGSLKEALGDTTAMASGQVNSMDDFKRALSNQVANNWLKSLFGGGGGTQESQIPQAQVPQAADSPFLQQGSRLQSNPAQRLMELRQRNLGGRI